MDLAQHLLFFHTLMHTPLCVIHVFAVPCTHNLLRSNAQQHSGYINLSVPSTLLCTSAIRVLDLYCQCIYILDLHLCLKRIIISEVSVHKYIWKTTMYAQNLFKVHFLICEAHFIYHDFTLQSPEDQCMWFWEHVCLVWVFRNIHFENSIPFFLHVFKCTAEITM